MTVLNFSHPLTEGQLRQLEELTQTGTRVVSVATHLDNARPFAEQVQALLDDAGLSPDAWQSEPLVVVLPGHAVIAALVLAGIHGRSGCFPTVARLRPVEGSPLSQFEVAELIPLQAVRDDQRKERAK